MPTTEIIANWQLPLGMLAVSLRGSTIEAMMKMSDLELGLDAVMRGTAKP